VTVRSAQEVAQAWVNAGGPVSRQAEWVAIAMGESSLNDAAVSPDGAIGTWQIMPFNAGVGGGTVSDLFDMNYNAKVAVLMSSGGTNCAAWDSCYVDIERDGRLSFLAYPQQGSADWNNLAIAAVALGVDATATALAEPSLGLGDDIASMAAGVQTTINTVLPGLDRNIAIERTTVGALYQPGWKTWAYSRL
jgi:hypothetical protein